MRYYPEPALDEPAAAVYGRCCVCGGELYHRDDLWDRLCPWCRAEEEKEVNDG